MSLAALLGLFGVGLGAEVAIIGAFLASMGVVSQRVPYVGVIVMLVGIGLFGQAIMLSYKTPPVQHSTVE